MDPTTGRAGCGADGSPGHAGGWARYEREIREEFKDRFPKDIQQVTRPPDDVYHRFRLKDPDTLTM